MGKMKISSSNYFEKGKKIPNCNPKNGKVKRQSKKETIVCPRLRLEPRLSPIKTSVNGKNNKNGTSYFIQTSSSVSPVKKHVKCIPSNDFIGEMKLSEAVKFEDKTNDLNMKCDSETCNSYKSVRDQICFFKSSAVSTPVTVSSLSKMQFKQRLKRKPKMRKGYMWRDRELLKLTTALQKYGFKDTKKIAEYVETKNENQIKDYIRLRSVDIRSVINSEKLQEATGAGDINRLKTLCKDKNSSHGKGRPKNRWSQVCLDHLPHWPNIRRWRRLAFEQMLSCSRSKDYSRSVITALLTRFYEEEPQPPDPQVINVKAIYKYLLDCMSDEIPGQLPPKESALMVDLLKDLRLLPFIYDFDEETKFLECYKEATQYKPFQIKDEFKKQIIKSASKEDGTSSKFLSVPEEIFTNLSRHKKVVQSFNPLMIPVWMMQKGQEYTEQII